MATTPQVKLTLDLPEGSAPVKIVSTETKTGRDAGEIRMAVADEPAGIELDGDKHAILRATEGTLGTQATLESDKASTHNVEGAITSAGMALSKFVIKPGEKAIVGILTDIHQISLRLGAEAPPAPPPQEKLESEHPAE